jgi:predicted deacylase
LTGQFPALKTSRAKVRAVEGGLFRARRELGDFVEAGEVLGQVSDPFGDWEAEVLTTYGGLIIGRAVLPLVNQGDALFHIAKLPRAVDPGALPGMGEELSDDPLFDEDEIR